MLSEVEIRAIAKKIVDESKRTAHVDQGSLKRSIAYTYVKGVVNFRELYYGQWNDNSQLEKNASKYMPNGVPYKIIFTTLGGDTYEVSKTKQGRTSQRKVLQNIKRTSTENIKRLINLAQSKKNNGKEKK